MLRDFNYHFLIKIIFQDKEGVYEKGEIGSGREKEGNEEEKLILGWTKFIGRNFDQYIYGISSGIIKVKNLKECPYKCKMSNDHK